jgi:hypothetical protein
LSLGLPLAKVEAMPYSEYARWCKYFADEPPLSMWMIDKMLAQICFVQARVAGNKHSTRAHFELLAPVPKAAMSADQFKAGLRKYMGFQKKT